MDGIIFYNGDIASSNTFFYLSQKLKENDFKLEDPSLPEIITQYSNGKTTFIMSKTDLLHSEYLDKLSFENLIFVSKHISSMGVAAFTVHSTGNWLSSAEYGGEPYTLSIASPLKMLTFLKALNSIQTKSTITYEATHHGPLLKTPSLFLEFGGSELDINNTKNAELLAKILYSSINPEAFSGKIVIGIGLGHYPKKFTSLALSKDYAFSHILPKYAIEKYDIPTFKKMVLLAISSSKPFPKLAVIEKKGLNKFKFDTLLYLLKEKGLDYEFL